MPLAQETSSSFTSSSSSASSPIVDAVLGLEELYESSSEPSPSDADFPPTFEALLNISEQSLDDASKPRDHDSGSVGNGSGRTEDQDEQAADAEQVMLPSGE